jgi:hypothetical protein
MNDFPIRAFNGANDFAYIADRLSKEELTVLCHDKDDPEYAYTIGNWVHGLPELIIFGGAPKDHTAILYAASDYQYKHRNIVDGGDFPFINKAYKIKDVPLSKVLSSVKMLTFFFHNVFKVRQLVMPMNGKYPWEDGYDRACDQFLPCLWV